MFCTLPNFQQIKQNSLNSPTDSMNYAKFAPVITHLYYIMSQAPAPAENSQEFERIMQILRSSPT